MPRELLGGLAPVVIVELSRFLAALIAIGSGGDVRAGTLAGDQSRPSVAVKGMQREIMFQYFSPAGLIVR